ncbi:MAG: membrane protein insertion efficiency factor YidD [Chloroflexi bacterium RBG_13_51_36]|nr:MAG: membrane protein insertion efficiency factor YidD [Chloroflexi bacterium RBG_13_51_36]
MAKLALGLIGLYQNTVSRVLPHACRFQPTCSHYAVEAIKKYGLIRGSRMAAKRIIRCNPFTEGGFDPVP